jgi:transcriptional regulator with XRE-family HTH domain
VIDPPLTSADFLRQQIDSLGWKKAEFARRVGRKSNSVDRWFKGPKPVRPEWEAVAPIADALELDFDVVARALGYRRPGEVAPPAMDAWEIESRRRSRELQDVLLRTPADDQPVVTLAADVALTMLGRFVAHAIAAGRNRASRHRTHAP